jgi:hypothetical protein
VPESLMSSIDVALARVTALGLANAAANAPNTATSVATSAAGPARQLRDALHALVGLRLSLFPATIASLTPPAPPKEEPAA